MDLFNLTKTKEQITLEQVASIVDGNRTALDRFIQDFEISFWKVWANSQLTPQEVFTAFGNDAYKLFQIAGQIVYFIQSLRPDYLPPEIPTTYTINNDGTVTTPAPYGEN